MILAEIEVAGPAENWEKAGFSLSTMDDGGCKFIRFDNVTFRITGPERVSGGKGIRSWTFIRDIDAPSNPSRRDLDSLDTVIRHGETYKKRLAKVPKRAHPNGVTGLDHIVVFTPNLESFVLAIKETLDTQPRRQVKASDDGLRPPMAFYKLSKDNPIIEVVQVKGGQDQASQFWGLTFMTTNMNTTTTCLKGRFRNAPKPARQGQGRVIVTLDATAVNIQIPIAIITFPDKAKL